MERKGSRFMVLKHGIQQEILFLVSTFPHRSGPWQSPNALEPIAMHQ